MARYPRWTSLGCPCWTKPAPGLSRPVARLSLPIPGFLPWPPSLTRKKRTTGDQERWRWLPGTAEPGKAEGSVRKPPRRRLQCFFCEPYDDILWLMIELGGFLSLDFLCFKGQVQGAVGNWRRTRLDLIVLLPAIYRPISSKLDLTIFREGMSDAVCKHLLNLSWVMCTKSLEP